MDNFMKDTEIRARVGKNKMRKTNKCETTSQKQQKVILQSYRNGLTFGQLKSNIKYSPKVRTLKAR